MLSILLFLDNVIFCETSDRVLDCSDREVLDSVTSVRDNRKHNDTNRGIDDSIFVEFIFFCGIVDCDALIELLDDEKTLRG